MLQSDSAFARPESCGNLPLLAHNWAVQLQFVGCFRKHGAAVNLFCQVSENLSVTQQIPNIATFRGGFRMH